MRSAEDRLLGARVTQRLGVEFGCLGEPTISRVVTGCRHDLAGVPPAALPELVERLARQRLLDREHPAEPREIRTGPGRAP